MKKRIVKVFLILMAIFIIISTILGGIEFFEYIEYTFDPSLNLGGSPTFPKLITYPYFWRKLFLFIVPLCSLIMYVVNIIVRKVL